MIFKRKKLLVGILMNVFSTTLFAELDIFNGVFVSGPNMLERVEGSYISEGNNDEKSGGGTPINQVAIISDQGTLDNYGTIKSNESIYQTQLVIIADILGIPIGGMSNKLAKTDELILMDRGILKNNGTIEMGSTYHKIHNVSLISLGGYHLYSEYTKNLITAENSTIENNGTIIRKGDKFKNSDDVNLVAALVRTEANYTKNTLNLTNTTVTNNGEITSGRDYNPELVDYLEINLLNLGLTYNRTSTAVKASGGIINNEKTGLILNGGDIYKGENDMGGVTVAALGADFLGTHNKYGVILNNGGVLNNAGIIEVERDYRWREETDGSIIEIGIVGDDVLGVGLLNFNNMKENSIAVSLNNSVFNNNNGTIKVGTNSDKKGLGLEYTHAVAIEANNYSTINFNGGNIELDGLNVYISDMKENSNMTFRGDTFVSFTQKGQKDLNSDIFSNDTSSKHYIKGNLTIDGDLTIGEDDNVIIGLAENPLPDENGNYQVIGDGSLGQIIVNGNFNGKTNIKTETSSLVGKDLNDYIGNSILVADNIISETRLNSDSYLFNISGEKIENDEKEEIVISDITRKNFNDIVTNNQLATIFETSYDNANAEQLEVYKVLAQGSDAQEFSQIVDEVTGKDTLVTLNSQVYDITKDLNKQFKDFAKTNIEDGIVFKYINSKSELEANSSSVGFDRKSSGIMVGYNNSVSEKLRLGAGFSYMKSNIDYTSASSNDITTWNLRGYSDYNLNFANLFTDFSFGYNQSENKRIAEQTSYTGLKEGDLDIYTVSLNNSLYKNYQINDKLIVMPSLNLDFTYLYQEDFEEKGNIGASADSTEAFYITTGIEIDAKYNLLSFDNSKINLIAGMDYSYDIVSENEDMNLKVSAFDPYYKEVIRELDKKSITYNLGLNYEYKDNYSVGVRYSKELINDVDNDQFGVDFTYKF